jgi:hypothetical protein
MNEQRPSPEGELTAEGMDGASLELALDLRRFRFLKALLIRLAVVWDPDDVSVSPLLESSEELEELDDANISVRIPGWDSSSIICWGVLS